MAWPAIFFVQQTGNSLADGGLMSASAFFFAEGGASDPLKWVFQDEHIIGNGSFGVVYQAVVQGSSPPRVRCAASGDRARKEAAAAAVVWPCA